MQDKVLFYVDIHLLICAKFILLIPQVGFPPLEDCREKAQSMVDTGNVRECVCYYLLSSTPEVAMSVGLPEIRSKFPFALHTSYID